MLQDVDNMEASWVFYVKVSMFIHLEQRKPYLLTVNKSGIVRLTIRHDLIVSVSFRYYPGDSLRQTSANIFSQEQFSICSRQSCEFRSRTPQLIAVNLQTTSDRYNAHLRAEGNSCNLQLSAAGILLSITNMLAANYSILTRS